MGCGEIAQLSGKLGNSLALCWFNLSSYLQFALVVKHQLFNMYTNTAVLTPVCCL